MIQHPAIVWTVLFLDSAIAQDLSPASSQTYRDNIEAIYQSRIRNEESLLSNSIPNTNPPTSSKSPESSRHVSLCAIDPTFRQEFIRSFKIARHSQGVDQEVSPCWETIVFEFEVFGEFMWWNNWHCGSPSQDFLDHSRDVRHAAHIIQARQSFRDPTHTVNLFLGPCQSLWMGDESHDERV